MKTQRRGGRRVRPRNDTEQLRWTERDIQVQCWIGEQAAVRVDHVLHVLQPAAAPHGRGRERKLTPPALSPTFLPASLPPTPGGEVLGRIMRTGCAERSDGVREE